MSLLDLLPTFCDLAGVGERRPHDGDSLLPLLEGDGEERTIFAQAHEAVGMPCILEKEETEMPRVRIIERIED